MSAPGRPQGEFRSAQHEGAPLTPHGRPMGEVAAVCITEVSR
jgi:hypothetical protein